MGILQMETENRPDGERPGGEPTYLDHVRRQAKKKSRRFVLSEDECLEMDREFLQYYNRRICWLALREFERAVADADHTLALMDFVATHSPNRDWTVSHEQYRPFVLFHRTQAAALARLEDGGPESALEEIDRGLGRIRGVFEGVEGEEQFDDDELVEQLKRLKEWIRDHYHVGRTLAEQLAEAVATEQYELAAQLRDQIARRDEKR